MTASLPHSARLFRFIVLSILTASLLRAQDITPAQKEVGFGPARYTLSIESPVPWTIADVPHWVTLSRSSGLGNGSLIVTVSANPDPSARSAQFSIGSTSHTLNQAARGESLRELFAMGDNVAGQLGTGSVASTLPEAIATDVVAVAGGQGHSVFLTSDGTAYAMGWNVSGQLGDGSNRNRATPVAIASDIARVAAGGYTSFLIKSPGFRRGHELSFHQDRRLTLGYGSQPLR